MESNPAFRSTDMVFVGSVNDLLMLTWKCECYHPDRVVDRLDSHMDADPHQTLGVCSLIQTDPGSFDINNCLLSLKNERDSSCGVVILCLLGKTISVGRYS